MPIYKVTQKSTGMAIKMEGENPPSQDDVSKAFAAIGRSKHPEAPTIGAAPTLVERAMDVLPSFARVATPLVGAPSVSDIQTVTRSVRQALEPEPKPQMLPEASRLDREGLMALLTASPEDRETGKQIGESIGGVVGPKTAAAGGVVGQVAADLLTPLNVATLGTLGAGRQAARLPATLARIGEAVTAADVAAAANAARLSRGAELGIAAAFTPQAVSGVAQSTARATDVFLDKDSTPEDKTRAATEAAVSVLMASLVGAGLKEGGSKGASEYIKSIEALADKKVGIEKGLENLERARVELDALEATLPKEKTAPISDQQLRFEESLAETRALVDTALKEAQQKIQTGEQPAIEKLKAQEREIITPEQIGEGPRETTPSRIPTEEAPSTLKTAEQMLAQRVEPVFEEPVVEAPRESTPLRSIDDILAQQMRQRTASRIAEQLESGTEVLDPATVSRRMIEKSLGVGREPVGQAAGESLIIREAAELAKERALQGGGEPAPEAPPVQPEPAPEAPVQPEAAPTKKRFSKRAKEIAESLESARVKVEAGLGANPFPQLMGTAWNGAIVVAQNLIRAGGSVADAIEAGLRYAKENFKDKFDETEFTRQLGSTILKPSTIKPEPGMEPRRFAARTAAAPGVPPVIREAVAVSPEAQYKPQNVESVVRQASTMTDAQIESDIANAKSNTRVASSMEKFNRQISAGDMGGATQTALAMAKSGTTWGQLINQFKLLNSSTPEGLVRLVTQSLAESGKKPMTPEQATEIARLMDRLNKSTEIINNADRRLKEAAESGDPTRIKISEGLAKVADALKNESEVEMNRAIARVNPSSAADLYLATVQGAVMGPLSIVRNILGNTINLPLRESSDILSSLLDGVRSSNKNNTYNIQSRTVERVKAFGNSLPNAAKILLKGSEAMPYEIGTDVGNPLNFQRAWKNIVDALAGDYEKAQIPRNLYEATVGVLPDIILRLTQATDVPFRAAERARIVSELGKQRGLNDAQVKVAIRKPELYLITDEAAARGSKGFTEDDLGVIERESARSVYQQENVATEAVAGVNRFIRDKAGSYGYIPYRLLSLFQKTPINVAGEALSFTPAGVLRNWRKLSPRDQNTAVARLVVGGMMMAAFDYLTNKGVIAPNLDTPGETSKARELAKSGGVQPPGTFNVSGSLRLISGKDPKFKSGDEVKDLTALGTAGALAIMVSSAKRIQERSREGDPDYLAIAKGGVLSGINFVMEQQFLKGTRDFIKLLSEESGNAVDRWLKSLTVTAASPLAPNTFAALRRAQRPTVPAIDGEGFIKDAIAEMNQRYAALGLKIPGTKDPNKMPARRDLWGDIVEQTPKGENPYLWNFFDAWKSRSIEPDQLNTSIYEVWRRTAENKSIPSLPNPKMTFGGVTYEDMTPEQYDRFSELVGKNRRTLAERVYMSGAYQQGGDDRKIDMLDKAYEGGLRIGKMQFMRELRASGQSLTPLGKRRGLKEPSPE